MSLFDKLFNNQKSNNSQTEVVLWNQKISLHPHLIFVINVVKKEAILNSITPSVHSVIVNSNQAFHPYSNPLNTAECCISINFEYE